MTTPVKQSAASRPTGEVEPPGQPTTINAQPTTEITAFESTVISIFTDAMQALGLPKSYGEIYGLLFASAEPLGFSEINARLAISKGSVSQGLKALREVGAIIVETSALDHRERYRPQLELRQLVVAFLERSVQPQLQSTEERLRQAEQQLVLVELDPAARRLLEERLTKLLTWRSKAAGLLPWITKFLG